MSGQSTPTPAPGNPKRGAGAPRKSSNRGKLFFFTGLVIFGASILWWLGYGQKQVLQKQATVAAAAVQTAQVTRGPLEVRVRVTGQTSARNYANIIAPKLTSPDGGGNMVLLSLAKSGSTVAQDQVVGEVDPQSFRDHLDDTIDGLRDKDNDVEKKKVQNELDMKKLQQSLLVAKSNVDKARLDFQAEEIRTEVDRELLKLALEEAEATYKEKQMDLPREVESQRADLRITEISRQMEIIHAERHKNDLGRLAIRTPMPGMVVVLAQHRPGGDQMTYGEGDRLNPGTPFMKVIDPKSLQVEALINQAESSRFRIGQHARVHLDAYPGASYEAKVYSIGALAVGGRMQNYYIRTVPVRIQIINPDSRAIPDLSASADVLVDKAENVLIAPASAVFSENGKDFVYLKSPTGWDKRAVSVGLSNGTQVVIQEGVNEGDVLRLAAQ